MSHPFDNTVIPQPPRKAIVEVPFDIEPNNTQGSFRVRQIGGNGAHRWAFHVPQDFGELVELFFWIFPAAGAAASGRDIDLTAEYGLEGEVFNNISEADTTSTYDFSAGPNVLQKFHFDHVFTQLAAGHVCGIDVDHNGIGGNVYYVKGILRYRRK